MALARFLPVEDSRSGAALKLSLASCSTTVCILLTAPRQGAQAINPTMSVVCDPNHTTLPPNPANPPNPDNPDSDTPSPTNTQHPNPNTSPLTPSTPVLYWHI